MNLLRATTILVLFATVGCSPDLDLQIAGTPCTTSADCKDWEPCGVAIVEGCRDLCRVPVCVDGQCRNGEPYEGRVPEPLQTPQDCRALYCQAGEVETRPDSADVPEVSEPCKRASCSWPDPTEIEDAPDGTSCSIDEKSGACVAGSCQPRLAEFVRPAHVGGVGLAFFDDTLYWIDADRAELHAGDIAGGPGRLVAADVNANEVEVDAEGIVWLDPAVGILQLDVGGGSPQLLADVPGAELVRRDGTHAYWLDRAAETVMRVSRAGGTPEVAASDDSLAGVNDLALDPSHVYWVAAGDLHRVGKTGGAVEIVAGSGSSTAAGRDLHVEGGWAVWHAGGCVRKASTSGDQGPSCFVDLGTDTIVDLAFDGDVVYWAVRYETIPQPVLWKQGTDGQPEALAFNTDGVVFAPTDLALAPGHLYWLTEGGSVYRVPR